MLSKKLAETAGKGRIGEASVGRNWQIDPSHCVHIRAHTQSPAAFSVVAGEKSCFKVALPVIVRVEPQISINDLLK